MHRICTVINQVMRTEEEKLTPWVKILLVGEGEGSET